jgi:hypothetical protein
MIRVKLPTAPTGPLTARERTLIRNLRELPAERQETVLRYADYVVNRPRGAALIR